MTGERAARLRKRHESTVRRYMDEQALWPEDGRLLVAVSGGPDSSALLLILAGLARRRALALTVAYFDHGLRGSAEAAAEAAAVRRLAQSLGLALVEGSGDVRGRARREHLSIEDAARRERYAFLAKAARDSGCYVVATGHTASDQAETVLLHLVRGAGLGGIGGMAARSDWPVAQAPGLTLIRPLLTLTAEDTRAYCEAAGICPVQDASNQSRTFLRNRLRHETLPALRALNPRIDAALTRLADAARTDEAFIDRVAAPAVAAGEDGTLRLSRETLAGWETAPRRHALRLALAELGGDAQGFGERHVLALERLLLSGRTGDSLDLPRDVSATLSRDGLDLRLLRSGARMSLPAEGVHLDVPGEARLGPLWVCAAPEARAAATESVVVDAEAVGSVLTVRKRRPGDRFQPLGMAVEKKLQDFFVDEHVGRSLRDSIPVFETERGIAWVGSRRIAEWAKPRQGRATVVLSYGMNERDA